MFSMLLGSLLFALAQPDGAPVRLTFRDAAVHDGRGMLAFRTVPLDDKPVRPVALPAPAPAGARYSLLRVGSEIDAALAVVWAPQAKGGAQLWLDADGDGRITPEERHTLAGRELIVPVTMTVRSEKGPKRLKRFLVFRRSALDDGLSYAVRGFAHGTLRLGGVAYPVLLTDGNADGCFDDPAADRLWIDLNRDGRFDPLTEQFPLGSPITVDGQTYTIRSDATAAAVRVYSRTMARGSVRLTLTGKGGRPVRAVTADLVSEFGELISVRQPDRLVSVPAGRYRVGSLRFEMTDGAGRTWSYTFASARRYDIEVREDGKTDAAPLTAVAFEAGVTASAGRGAKVTVAPQLSTPSGLYLVDCTVKADGALEATPCKADIRLLDAAGIAVDRTSSGFQ